MLPLGSQSSCMSYSVVGLKPESFQVSCQAVFSLNEDRLCATDPNNSSSPGFGGGVSEATWLGQKEPWESGHGIERLADICTLEAAPKTNPIPTPEGSPLPELL